MFVLKLSIQDIIRENKKFEEFYKAQEICPEQEFEQMIKVIINNYFMSEEYQILLEFKKKRKNF